MEPLTELERQFARLAAFIECDGLADVIHDHLAGVASGHVFFELRADGWVHRALNILVQRRQ